MFPPPGARAAVAGGGYMQQQQQQQPGTYAMPPPAAPAASTPAPNAGQYAVSGSADAPARVEPQQLGQVMLFFFPIFCFISCCVHLCGDVCFISVLMMPKV